MTRFGLVLCAMLAALPAALAAPDDTRLRSFEAQLEANPSATAVLQDWCNTHAPKGTRIAARRVQLLSAVPTVPNEGWTALMAKNAPKGIKYRSVQLMCGDRVLSNADNWYLPDQLTDAMNATLDHTQTPFGVAVADLHFTRRNLETRYLPRGGPDVLRHSAVLVTGKGTPFSFVVETYTKAILGD